MSLLGKDFFNYETHEMHEKRENIFKKVCNYSAEVEAYSLKNLKVASRLTMIDRMHRISSGNRSIHPVNYVNYVKNPAPCHNAMVG